MWDLPGPVNKPVSPALAGGFLTTAPPGKSRAFFYWDLAHCLHSQLCWTSQFCAVFREEERRYTIRKGWGEEGMHGDVFFVDPLCNTRNSLKLEPELGNAKGTKLTPFASSEDEFGRSIFRQFNHLFFFSLKPKGLSLLLPFCLGSFCKGFWRCRSQLSAHPYLLSTDGRRCLGILGQELEEQIFCQSWFSKEMGIFSCS